MLQTRIIPCLLLQNGALVKTVRFRRPVYVGDPINTVRIFNEKGVDELVFLDVAATKEGKKPALDLIEKIASECFMPIAYGGGIQSQEDICEVLKRGAEKVVINSAAAESWDLIREASQMVGSQSIVVSIDVRKPLLGAYQVYTSGGQRKTGREPTLYAREAESAGAGEILLTSIDHDGTWQGYDLTLIDRVARAVQIPVIACGGAGCVDDFKRAVQAGASAVAAGSMMVYQRKGGGVLINFPELSDLKKVLLR